MKGTVGLPMPSAIPLGQSIAAFREADVAKDLHGGTGRRRHQGPVIQCQKAARFHHQLGICMKVKPSICNRQLSPVQDAEHTFRMDFELAFNANVDLCS